MLQASERIDQNSVILLIQGDSQCIDRKIAAFLVVVDRSFFDDGFTWISPVGLFAGSDKLDLHTFIPEHGSTEVFKYRYPQIT